MRPTCLILVLLVGAGFAIASAHAEADGTWLDAPLASWNSPGMVIPAAPRLAGAPPDDPLCIRLKRPPETAEDAAVAGAGWTLFNTYQAGWDVKLVSGLVAHDGMCRPLNYQVFVFVDSVFAGTIAPQPMNARTDGAETQARISAGGDGLSAQFARYTDSDPLCCPSGTTSVEYRIVRATAGSVLVPVSAVATASAP